jgi:hypothetical protein
MAAKTMTSNSAAVTQRRSSAGFELTFSGDGADCAASSTDASVGCRAEWDTGGLTRLCFRDVGRRDVASMPLTTRLACGGFASILRENLIEG